MYKHLLIATDGFSQARRRWPWACAGQIVGGPGYGRNRHGTVDRGDVRGFANSIHDPDLREGRRRKCGHHPRRRQTGRRRGGYTLPDPPYQEPARPRGNHQGREGGRMRSHHRGLARTRRTRPNAPRQHLVENSYLQPRRRSSLSLGALGCGSYLLVDAAWPFGEERLRIQYGAHDRGAFGGRSASSASAQMGLADPKRGQDLSARLCSGCHIVAPGSAATANADVPTFAAIAGRARYDRRAPCRAHHRSASTDAEYSAHRRGNARHHCVHPVSEASALKADAFQTGGSLIRRHPQLLIRINEPRRIPWHG